MGYSDKLRSLFPDTVLHPEDLLLLETFQIKNLPERVAVKEFTTLLHTYPVVHRFLIAKYPAIGSFMDHILEENQRVEDDRLVEEHCQEALWEIADLIIYNKYPEKFDEQAPNRWDIEEIHAITSLEGKVVADVGAGSGRIAFMVAPFSQTVYAVEPVTSLRAYMKEKASRENSDHIFVMDGTLDAIPIPTHTLDVLLTSNAIGWNLDEELREIERVVKPGGHAIHLLWSDIQYENPYHETLTSRPWEYNCLEDGKDTEFKLRYYKEI